MAPVAAVTDVMVPSTPRLLRGFRAPDRRLCRNIGRQDDLRGRCPCRFCPLDFFAREDLGGTHLRAGVGTTVTGMVGLHDASYWRLCRWRACRCGRDVKR